MIAVERIGIPRLLAIPEFQAMTGVAFIPELDFESVSFAQKIAAKIRKVHAKGKLPREQLWRGSYYKNEIQTLFFPKTTIRWIDDAIGWGVFSAKAFKKGEFVAEYSGKVRKRTRKDAKNAYCFEYALTSNIRMPYLIDAQDQGGIARFINHSSRPNLCPMLVTFNWVNHVILVAKEDIREGIQICFDYGADYWSSRRTVPKNLIFV
ncbi:MAG TPA: SET domain-containing protein-lysine N-methyltransferase [Chlamydiales bacterium]|nr:SET domain-containing protein-lysine N-methyltransferase [Chlamydiales bacterium]